MWKILIKDKKNEIWDHEIELIVRDLPEKFRKFIPVGETMKQPNGYPAYLEIGIPDKHGFTISGNYITNTPEDSKKFVEYIFEELRKNGHQNFEVTIAKDSDGDLFGIMEFIGNMFCKDLFVDYNNGNPPTDAQLKVLDKLDFTIDSITKF